MSHNPPSVQSVIDQIEAERQAALPEHERPTLPPGGFDGGARPQPRPIDISTTTDGRAVLEWFSALPRAIPGHRSHPDD
jgi:hypothetical protein